MLLHILPFGPFWFTVTGSLTDDNRNLYDVNKSEEYQSNICSPLPFNTECEEQFTNHSKFFIFHRYV